MRWYLGIYITYNLPMCFRKLMFEDKKIIIQFNQIKEILTAV